MAAALRPFPAADLGDRVDRFVTPRARFPVNGVGAPWNTGCCSTRSNRGMARLGVVSTIAAHGSDPFAGSNLVEQFGRDVADGLMRHLCGSHLTGVRVDRDMHLAPRATLRIAMLAHLPFAFAVEDLHARAVGHQMNRGAVPQDRQLDSKRLCPTAERRVARCGQGAESQTAQALREPLQGMLRQAEHCFQVKQRLIQCVAVQARTAARRFDLEHACRSGFVDPHRVVTSVDRPSVNGRPVLTR